MNFCSDNANGIAPDILAAIAAANEGPALGYGDDALTLRTRQKIADLFECEADVYFVTTGTAANSLALSVMTPPTGATFCHQNAHIETSECGAPEFFGGGSKLLLMGGPDGRISAGDLAMRLQNTDTSVHHVKPATISVSQLSEAGTVYSLDDLHAISKVAHDNGLKLHMDGARFANAVATFNCSPADASWRAGVDVLCFGATKNGAMGAEAVIFFDRRLSNDFERRRKRGGHLTSKMRFVAAQFDAYLTKDRWLDYASHANAQALRLAAGVSGLVDIRLIHPVDGNQVFVELPQPVVGGLRAAGFDFYDWSDGNEGSAKAATRAAIRLVTAFDTRSEDVDAFLATLRRLA